MALSSHLKQTLNRHLESLTCLFDCFILVSMLFEAFVAYFLMQSAAFYWFKSVSLRISVVWFGIDPVFPPPFNCPIKLLWMQVTDSSPTDAPQMLLSTITRVKGSCALATLWAYFDQRLRQIIGQYQAWSFEFTISKCGGLYQGIAGWGAIATGLRYTLPP